MYARTKKSLYLFIIAFQICELLKPVKFGVFVDFFLQFVENVYLC